MKRLFLFALVSIVVGLSACSVSRTMVTTQTTIKGQDTIVTQTTRQVETYDGTIKPKL